MKEDDFEEYAINIDSDLVNDDIDNIDPFGEDKFEYDKDDSGILYE